MPVPVALVATGSGVAWATGSGTGAASGVNAVEALRRLASERPRWTWWTARSTAPVLLDDDIAVDACWDLGAVGRLLGGGSRDDPAASWAQAHGLVAPPVPAGDVDLLTFDGGDGGPLASDGNLSADWCAGSYAEDLERATRWAQLALELQQRQEQQLRALPDRRATPRDPPLPLLTGYAESMAALFAVELERTGLPVDLVAADDLLAGIIGLRPVDDHHAAAQRRARDDAVRAAFADTAGTDLRNPAQVRELLTRIGLDVPDTRSWRLEPHAASLPAVAALLAWRKAERVATTYGWSWLDRNIGPDGRLRGAWRAAEGAGRMSAGAGLHNLPAELRPIVRAQREHVFVRADLGQVEPRVLAVVSGDEALAAAARESDMYAPVAAALRCDRPTAKVAVLAAMYGQTSGTAGAALRDMDRAYPRALAYLRDAEEAGRRGNDLRTYGGRLLRLSRPADDERFPPSAWGRFARNAVVQGAAAELFKAWTGTVRAGLRELHGELVLCLHDELLLHVPTPYAEQAAALLVTALDSTARWWAAGSGVRFVADVTTAASWAAAH